MHQPYNKKNSNSILSHKYEIIHIHWYLITPRLYYNDKILRYWCCYSVISILIHFDEKWAFKLIYINR